MRKKNSQKYPTPPPPPESKMVAPLSNGNSSLIYFNVDPSHPTLNDALSTYQQTSFKNVCHVPYLLVMVLIKVNSYLSSTYYCHVGLPYY